MLRIGKISNTRGLQGEVVLSHVLPDTKWLKAGTALMVSMKKDSFIPFFVKKFKPLSPTEVALLLEDIADPEEAKKLKGKEVFVADALIQNHTQESPLAWIGFKVKDKKRGALGCLEDVFQSGPQWLGKIRVEEKEVLLPLIVEFLLQVDVSRQEILTDLPEGLIEIYTQ